jgi:hypothetical protein
MQKSDYERSKTQCRRVVGKEKKERKKERKEQRMETS